MTAVEVSAGGRGARSEAIVLVALGVLVTILFAVTPLDVAFAGIFFNPRGVDHWPLAGQLPWSVLYRMAPWITASLVLVGFLGLAAGLVRRRETWRQHAIFVTLTVVVGPGLLINALFKDHWDRPRPRDIVEFGGPLHYVPAPLWGEGGKSFPCGHCSVGYLYGMGWWIWKRRHPWWARASLAAGVLVGTALGFGRMAAGGHFLSDVVWSALLALSVAHTLYYYVLRIPAHEAVREVKPTAARAPQPRMQNAFAALVALGGIAVLIALFATPHGAQLGTTIQLSSLSRPPRVFEVSARTANIEIVVVDWPATEALITGELHGFGLPTSRLVARAEFAVEPVPTLRYRIEQHGWFTDLDGSASIRLPLGQLEGISVVLDHGNIKIVDATRARVIKSGRLRLDLRTARGHVQGP